MDQADRLRSKIKASKAQDDNRSRVITVTSGKGGVGKTSLSVNLALQMQRMGRRTIIIDADFGLANIEVMLGIHPRYNISDLIYRNKSIEDVITEGPEGIGFISGGSGVSELTNLNRDQVKDFVTKLSSLDKLADVVIIDTGAGISDAVQEFVLCSPEVLIVLTPEPTSTMDAYALLKALNRRKDFAADSKVINVVSNRVSDEKEGQELFRNISIVASRFLDIELRYLGCIPQDMNASRAVVLQKPVSLSFPNTAAARSMHRIALDLLERPDEKHSGFAAMFLNMLRIKKDRK